MCVAITNYREFLHLRHTLFHSHCDCCVPFRLYSIAASKKNVMIKCYLMPQNMCVPLLGCDIWLVRNRNVCVCSVLCVNVAVSCSISSHISFQHIFAVCFPRRISLRTLHKSIIILVYFWITSHSHVCHVPVLAPSRSQYSGIFLSNTENIIKILLLPSPEPPLHHTHLRMLTSLFSLCSTACVKHFASDVLNCKITKHYLYANEAHERCSVSRFINRTGANTRSQICSVWLLPVPVSVEGEKFFYYCWLLWLRVSIVKFTWKKIHFMG